MFRPARGGLGFLIYFDSSRYTETQCLCPVWHPSGHRRPTFFFWRPDSAYLVSHILARPTAGSIPETSRKADEVKWKKPRKNGRKKIRGKTKKKEAQPCSLILIFSKIHIFDHWISFPKPWHRYDQIIPPSMFNSSILGNDITIFYFFFGHFLIIEIRDLLLVENFFSYDDLIFSIWR